MTPEEARRRARAILDAQKTDQVIQLRPDGSLAPANEPAYMGKKTVLHDPKGEYARRFFWQADDLNASEYRISGFIGDVYGRHEVERQKLWSAFESVEIAQSGGLISQIAGSIEPVPGTFRDFQILVPGRYPYASPRAYSVGWNITGPHTYGNNEMCLWQSNQWRKDFTLAYAVAKTFTWIHKHEVYRGSGKWPGLEQGL